VTDRASFKTRARTVDHLGREQIADCPTAISELWKNAYDAYARRVGLEVFDGERPVALLWDDGHGMSRSEFEERWLVIGTESKVSNAKTQASDRFGLPIRTKQGQKGIGRLSSANLGPVLLIVSKRKGERAVAALVDWRLFENPFLNLVDIEFPIAEVKSSADLFGKLEDLAEILTTNITADGRSDKEQRRIKEAWSSFDQHASQLDNNRRAEFGFRKPSQAILESCRSIPFRPRHFQYWPILDDKNAHGTAMLVTDINDDLRAQLRETNVDTDATKSTAYNNLRQTLSQFVDPYGDLVEGKSENEFSYLVRSHTEDSSRIVLDQHHAFTRRQIESLEHFIEGTVDIHGVFRGRVRAFGNNIEDPVEIHPPKDLKIPVRSDTRVGPFDFVIGTFEQKPENSTHDSDRLSHLSGLADQYSGLMIYRDDLRVLPYGRVDSDFFEMEERRSKNAGREFWNGRRLFGRMAITRDQNANLKDKAGREGIIDNTAAKTFKIIVMNVLMQTARLYFGSSSDFRKDLLPGIKEANKKARAASARKKLEAEQKRKFLRELEKKSSDISTLVEELKAADPVAPIKNDSDLTKREENLQKLRIRVWESELPARPSELGSRTQKADLYEDRLREARKIISILETKLAEAVEDYNPEDPDTLLTRRAKSITQLHERQLLELRDELREYVNNTREIFDATQTRRRHEFQSAVNSVITAYKAERLDFQSARKSLSTVFGSGRSDTENTIRPFVIIMEAAAQSIDLEVVASVGIEDANDLRAEIDRLNQLAQLGIAVEILRHDLQDFDDIIADGLRRLPDDVKSLKAVDDIRTGYEGLVDQLKYLSPLQLAGEKVQRWISGKEIYEFVDNFFKPQLVRKKIAFTASDEFLNFRIFEHPSRLLPAFINLVNNSIYWVSTRRDNRQVRLSISSPNDGDRLICISDNGPGIDENDVPQIFQIFFTRKSRGGRGVGLYLTRANLSGGGHSIRYRNSDDSPPLEGAAFLIKLIGAEFSDE
jgi:signal transduction histidine kinase